MLVIKPHNFLSEVLALYTWERTISITIEYKGLVRLGGMSAVTGALGWRATVCSGGVGRAGELEVSHCKQGSGLIAQPLQSVRMSLRASG